MYIIHIFSLQYHQNMDLIKLCNVNQSLHRNVKIFIEKNFIDFFLNLNNDQKIVFVNVTH